MRFGQTSLYGIHAWDSLRIVFRHVPMAHSAKVRGKIHLTVLLLLSSFLAKLEKSSVEGGDFVLLFIRFCFKQVRQVMFQNKDGSCGAIWHCTSALDLDILSGVVE